MNRERSALLYLYLFFTPFKEEFNEFYNLKSKNLISDAVNPRKVSQTRPSIWSWFVFSLLLLMTSL